LHTEQRDANFIDNKKQFLSSALNREFRCIVLDRVLTFSNSPSSTPRILLRPEDIKQAAVQHFQNFVKPAQHTYHYVNDLPPRWQHIYKPVSTIDSNIYIDILALISIDELISVLNSLLQHKAADPSGITYEMLKLLSDAGRITLLDLCNQCFLQSDIPGDWRMANVPFLNLMNSKDF
jgi:hypothetical protein